MFRANTSDCDIHWACVLPPDQVCLHRTRGWKSGVCLLPTLNQVAGQGCKLLAVGVYKSKCMPVPAAAAPPASSKEGSLWSCRLLAGQLARGHELLARTYLSLLLSHTCPHCQYSCPPVLQHTTFSSCLFSGYCTTQLYPFSAPKTATRHGDAQHAPGNAAVAPLFPNCGPPTHAACTG